MDEIKPNREYKDSVLEYIDVLLKKENTGGGIYVFGRI